MKREDGRKKKNWILDLTKKAQINRATFYAHYQDKCDLLDNIIGDSATAVIDKRTN